MEAKIQERVECAIDAAIKLHNAIIRVEGDGERSADAMVILGAAMAMRPVRD